MSEQTRGERPGHLDVDAVSAYVDRDLTATDLTTIEVHLHECPACHREVVEIRTTVTLLAALPQYTPRRSFCLGHEHARASSGGRRRSAAGPWPGPFAPVRPPGATVAPGAGGGRLAGWLPGLQAAAMVVGALLLLVTTSDLYGIPAQPADWLGEPATQAPLPMSESPPQSAPEVAPPAAAPAFMPTATAFAAEGAYGIMADEQEGTSDADRASEEMLADEELAAPAPMPRAMATSAAAAAVTQAAPTAAAGLAPGAASQEPAATAQEQPAPTASEPSRLRLIQIALAFALAWLVVSIAGLRWVRSPR